MRNIVGDIRSDKNELRSTQKPLEQTLQRALGKILGIQIRKSKIYLNMEALSIDYINADNNALIEKLSRNMPGQIYLCPNHLPKT